VQRGLNVSNGISGALHLTRFHTFQFVHRSFDESTNTIDFKRYVKSNINQENNSIDLLSINYKIEDFVRLNNCLLEQKNPPKIVPWDWGRLWPMNKGRNY